ncbi:MAG: hypothetical protein MUD14_02355 [Hydrococcus sp. Prado102]|nr:hypothetical protein [Hydrococcus sp. Prado102]
MLRKSALVLILVDLAEKYIPQELIIEFAWIDAQTFEYPQHIIDKAIETRDKLGGEFGVWLDIIFAEYSCKKQILKIVKKQKIPNQEQSKVCFTLIKALVICTPDPTEIDVDDPLALKNWFKELHELNPEKITD